MGGVSAISSPITMRSSRSVLPSALAARSVTRWVPRVVVDPEIRPLFSSNISPGGNPSAAKLIGRFPVAGMANKKGRPGRAPNTLAPLIRGFGEGFGVRM